MYLFVFQIWIRGIRRLTTPRCLGILINFQLSKVLCHATPEGSLSLDPDGRCRRYSTLHHRRFSSYNPRWYNDCRLSTTKVSHPTQKLGIGAYSTVWLAEMIHPPSWVTSQWRTIFSLYISAQETPCCAQDLHCRRQFTERSQNIQPNPWIEELNTTSR